MKHLLDPPFTLAEDRRSATGSGKENAATVDAREENADGAALVDVGDGTSEQPSHIPSPFAGVRVTLDMKTFHAVMQLQRHSGGT